MCIPKLLRLSLVLDAPIGEPRRELFICSITARAPNWLGAWLMAQIPLDSDIVIIFRAYSSLTGFLGIDLPSLEAASCHRRWLFRGAGF